jgi:hypothetical protein
LENYDCWDVYLGSVLPPALPVTALAFVTRPSTPLGNMELVELVKNLGSRSVYLSCFWGVWWCDRVCWDSFRLVENSILRWSPARWGLDPEFGKSDKFVINYGFGIIFHHFFILIWFSESLTELMSTLICWMALMSSGDYKLFDGVCDCSPVTVAKNWLDLRNDLSLSCALISWRVCRCDSDSAVAGGSTADRALAEHGILGSCKRMTVANSGPSSIVRSIVTALLPTGETPSSRACFSFTVSSESCG